MSRFAISEFTACRPLGKRDWSWGWRFLQTTWSSQEPSPILLQVPNILQLLSDGTPCFNFQTQSKDLLHHVSRTMKKEELFFFLSRQQNKQTTNFGMRSYLLMEDFLHHSTSTCPTIYNILSIPFKWMEMMNIDDLSYNKNRVLQLKQSFESDLRYRFMFAPT